MADDETAIEIQLTPRYDRAKRNLIFIAVVIIAIAIADRSDTRIPGLGDAAMPTWAALLGLSIALVYCADGFWREFAFASVRNSRFAEGRSSEDLGAAFQAREQALHEFAEHVSKLAEYVDPDKSTQTLNVQMVQIDDYLRGIRSQAAQIASATSDVQKAAKTSGYLERPVSDDRLHKGRVVNLDAQYKSLDRLFAISSGLPKDILDSLSRVERDVDVVKKTFLNMSVVSQNLAEKIAELSDGERSLVREITTLSDNVFRSHRTSFRRIDRIAIGILLPAIAVISAIARLLYQYGPCC